MNQAAHSHECINDSQLVLAEPFGIEANYECSSSVPTGKPKNVPEELKMFLMTHSNQWYTNEQLAEHLKQ